MEQKKDTISKNEFKVLSFIKLYGKASQRMIAEKQNISVGSVNAAINHLLQNGFINQRLDITELGYKALEPYKVKNAVILAAGLSSRFVPLSYEKPKGLLMVNGQILIERQIEQLHEAGIFEIFVVVGYMKELFFYLEQKYDVKIIINNEFALRNNHSSIYKVKDYLDNTYILSSDNYFSDNVFEPYIYNSFYAVEYMSGDSTERGVKVNRSGRIIQTFPNASNCWILLGHVYWNRDFSKAFIKSLETIYDKEETKPLLWERIFDRFLKQLPPIYIRKYYGIIHEFDSLDELRLFDQNYIKNIDSNIIDNISISLGCNVEDLSMFEPLKNGQTNDSFTFFANNKKYVYRHCSIFTSTIVDRSREAYIQKLVDKLDIDHTCIAINPEYGWKISRFLENRSINFNDDAQLSIAIELMHKLHDSNIECPWTFDFRKEIQKVHQLINQISDVYRNVDELHVNIDLLLDIVESENWPKVLCHNDINCDNFLMADTCELIDWEYAGLNDVAYDIAKLVLKTEAKGSKARDIISKYYGRSCTDQEYRHIIACGAIEDYYWMIWAIYLEKNGRNLENGIYIWHKHALEYGKEALALYSV